MNPIAILCIDDDRIMLQALAHQISTFLHEDVIIEVAESGKEGLEVINELIDDKYTIPVVISDQMMPGMTGVEFARAAQGQFTDLKVILLTGYSKDSIETIESQKNIISTLQKPWEKSELKSILSRFYPMK
jgi:YesN/AraC family two-component response regulator